MSERTLSRKACLALPVELYNAALKKTYPDRVYDVCVHCSRLYYMVCICPTAAAEWDKVIEEVREVSEHNNRDEFVDNCVSTSYTLDDLKSAYKAGGWVTQSNDFGYETRWDTFEDWFNEFNKTKA